MIVNGDLKIIESVKEYIEKRVPEFFKEVNVSKKNKVPYPLDDTIVEKLNIFEIGEEDDDYRIFYYVNEIKEIWKLVIEKSIKCLRFFDGREPFLKDKSKKPVAYGVNKLSNYFEKYTELENLLYGREKYYQDYVVHVFRVWLLGLECLLDNDGEYLKRINIQEGISVNSFEKISIWSIIALTHDLGYPVEKFPQIIGKTKDMMKSFSSNPIISMDLSFNGIQNNINDFVVYFMSLKMHEVDNKYPGEETVIKSEKTFVTRLQSKYYFKFKKSLEDCNHGMLSAIIIYKLLIYFWESNVDINEDCKFDEEDARQFYIRREILRAVAAHTCHDIYHLDMLNFGFLLIMVDDAQEWGRKRISELYVKRSSNYKFDSITPLFDVEKGTYKSLHGGEKINIHKFIVKEQFKFPKGELENLKEILSSLMKQSSGYQEIFRDGQDTAKRNFIFEKDCDVVYEEHKIVKFGIHFVISNEEKPTFELNVSSTNKNAVDETYGKSFLEEIYKGYTINQVDVRANETKYEIT